MSQRKRAVVEPYIAQGRCAMGEEGVIFAGGHGQPVFKPTPRPPCAAPDRRRGRMKAKRSTVSTRDRQGQGATRYAKYLRRGDRAIKVMEAAAFALCRDQKLGKVFSISARSPLRVVAARTRAPGARLRSAEEARDTEWRNLEVTRAITEIKKRGTEDAEGAGGRSKLSRSATGGSRGVAINPREEYGSSTLSRSQTCPCSMPAP